MDSSLVNSFDDFKIVAGDAARTSRITLTGLVHNEMFFLPEFLPHYRRLGVDRFVLLDDQSTDGTGAFLAAQPDVVVVHSQRRFGDRAGQHALAMFGYDRMDLIWRTLLINRFAPDVWSLHLDADEFLDLPNGMTLQDVTMRADASGGDTVWAVMMDMYPERVSSLELMAEDKTVDLRARWYFDGCPHLQLRRSAPPRKVYTGARARLLHQFGLNPKSNRIARLGARLGFGPPNYNAIRKPVLLRWRPDARFLSSHSTTLNGDVNMLLPLRHYKFNGALSARITEAVAAGMHPGGASEYADLAGLLAAMKLRDSSFLCPISLNYTGFEDFRKAGVSIGF
jgi:hypothetical protein